MKFSGKTGLTVAAAAAGIVLLFNVVSAGGNDTPLPVAPAPVAAVPQDAAPLWGVEFEGAMRRDIAALAEFIVKDVGPVVESQKETAPVLALARGYQQRLSGCAGVASMADHALALNDLLGRAHVLFTALEVLEEREQNIPTGPDAAARLSVYRAIAEDFDRRYSRAGRWLWDINNAFAAAHPDMEERIEALREGGKLEGELHRKAEADSYAEGYPLTNTTPLRAPAQIFAPYAKGPVKAPVCP